MLQPNSLKELNLQYHHCENLTSSNYKFIIVECRSISLFMTHFSSCIYLHRWCFFTNTQSRDRIQLATQTVTVPIQHPGQSVQMCRKIEWTLPTTEPLGTRFFPLQTRPVYYRHLNLNLSPRNCKNVPLKEDSVPSRLCLLRKYLAQNLETLFKFFILYLLIYIYLFTYFGTRVQFLNT